MLDTAGQIAQESRMRSLGQHRAKAQITRSLERGEAAETPAGIALAKRALDPMISAIDAFKATAAKGRGGRRHTAALLLAGVPSDLAAYVAVRQCLSGAARGYILRSVANAIAVSLEMELMAAEFEQAEPALYRSVVRNAQGRGMAPSRIGKAVELTAKKSGHEDTSRWTLAERLHLGTKLVEIVIEKLGIVEAPLVKRGKNSAPTLAFTGEIDTWFDKFNHAASLTKPLYLPFVCPPVAWTGIYGGAFHNPQLGRHNPILLRRFPGHMDLLSKAELAPVFKGLNGLQETPWRINKKVLDVMLQTWEANSTIPCLPQREDQPIPEAPPEVVNDVKGGEYRKAWRQKVRVIHETNAASRSARFEFARALSVAQELTGRQAIYFPHRLDFRGRAYASSTSLNPQGSDDSRALLEFADGQPLGKRGIFWLAVHGANLWGNDKVSLEDREKWAWEHRYHVTSVVYDPLSDLWWTEADKPWSFLAWCFEMAEVFLSDRPEEVVSRMPVALDGSCNGIQHFSAMLRDPIGGAAVNLVPGETPRDIYQAVADEATRLLREAALVEDEKQWLAEGWLSFGLDRKITKRAVMVLPYGGTFKSCQDYVAEAVRERFKAGVMNPFGDELPKAIGFLASLVWRSIGGVVIAARQAMSWLQGCARVASKYNHPVHWTTPSGFVVLQNYREHREDRIKTRFCGSLVYFRSHETTEKIDKARQASAVSPNFVHALDASAMVLTIGACLDKGLRSFAMIHDSYGTHAADTDLLAETLRDQFVRLYSSHDVLTQFRDELAAQLPPQAAAELPPLPARGTLDLEAVRDSRYFFA